MEGWYVRHPQWFVAELEKLRRAYPRFILDEGMLHQGVVVIYGELVVRPPGGSIRHAVRVLFPGNSPYSFPCVTPVQAMPIFDEHGVAQSIPDAKIFDYRHQMPDGSLCLFRYETRVEEGGEAISIVDVLKRAEAWFVGHATGRWPPDSVESELQSHFFPSKIGVLLSKTFYSDRLRGSGEFFAVRDLHRFYAGQSQHEPPLIMTAATVETGVYEVVDARKDLEYIFPWLTNGAWTPESFIEYEERQRQSKQVEFGDLARVRGRWWELISEPKVFRDGKGLLAALSEGTGENDIWRAVSASLKTDLTLKKSQHIGLCYPGRSERREWLIVEVHTGARELKGEPVVLTEDQKQARFEKAKVTCIPAHGLTSKDIQLRNETVISSQIVEKKVAFLGLGALGAKVAELLAQAGISNFKLCDGDVLHVGNVARHVGSLSECGAPKTEVVSRRIWEVNPYAEIQVWNSHISPAASETEGFFSGVDLIICTIADEGAESGFNDLALAIKAPVVYGRALRRGQMGRAFLVRPGVDACKTCLSIIARSNEPEWIAVPERPEDALLHECGRPIIAGSAVDLSFVAALVARQALDSLEGHELSSNHRVWSLNGAGELSDKLKLPYSVALATFARKHGCPSCGEANVLTVELPDAVRASIVAEVKANPHTETGGILIGRIEGRRAIVSRATGPGPNAIKTVTRFERDVDFAQNELNIEVSSRSANSYIGEWHSHLVASPEPSGRDVLSMQGIAAAANYATDSPVMIICGFDQKEGKIGEIKAWVFSSSSSMRRMTIVDWNDETMHTLSAETNPDS
jgi:integrative and conjugative element protein (TIGR02256 family)